MRPIRKAGLYAYGGSNGLMLLSREPMADAGVLDFTDIATLNRRQALYIDVPFEEGNTRVYCTHLSADLSSIAPYPGSFDSWGDENAAQVQRLVEHAADVENVALVGDFNCGMAGEGLAAELPDSCQIALDAGYLDPVVDLSSECTWCADNLLNADDNVEHESLIDHIFTRGLNPQSAERAYTGTVDIGDGVTTSLSDHYGYRVTVTYGDPPPPPEPEPEVEEGTEGTEGTEGAEEGAEGSEDAGE